MEESRRVQVIYFNGKFLSFFKIVLNLHTDSLKKEIVGFDYLINKKKKKISSKLFSNYWTSRRKIKLVSFFFTIFFLFFAKFFLDIYRWGFPWHHQDKEVRIKTVLWFVDATSSFCEICSTGRWSSGYWGMHTCMGSQFLWITNDVDP